MKQIQVSVESGSLGLIKKGGKSSNLDRFPLAARVPSTGRPRLCRKQLVKKCVHVLHSHIRLERRAGLNTVAALALPNLTC